MLNLNETLLAHDQTEALADEVGRFEATSPTGEKFSVICRPGHSITNMRLEANWHSRRWHIRKVGDFGTDLENRL